MRARWSFIPRTPEGLWHCLSDLTSVDLQPALFAYLFPACLDFWYAYHA